MQEPLPPAALQEDRRRRALVAEREEPGLRHNISDALDPAEVHVTLRFPPDGLQRPSLHLRWGSRCGNV